jgi:hypothetical protein
MSNDPTLQEDFEVGGRFWLPCAPTRPLGGTLRYAGGRVTLRLLGVFESAPAGDIEDAEFILGSTERGPCTLWRSFRRRANTTIVGGDVDADTARSTWSSNRLFMGAHFDDVDKMLFAESRFAFQELPAWVARPAFEIDFQKHVATARFLDDIVVPLRARSATLRIDTGLTETGNVFESLTWKRPVEVAIEVPEPRPFEWHDERLGGLRALLGLLVGEPITPTRFRAVTADKRPVTVFFTLTGEPRERLVHPAEMIFAYPRIADRFPAIAERWFDLQDNLRVVVSLLFGTLYATGLPREFRFLALAQALETFHRRTQPGVYVDPPDYEPVREALTEAIPAGTNISLRQALEKRLEYGNEFAQHRRLNALLKSIVGSSDAVTTDPKGFIKAVVDERNYLTHYPPGKPEPMSAWECIHTATRLRAFLMLVLLAEVGLTGPEAAEGVRRPRWYS